MQSIGKIMRCCDVPILGIERLHYCQALLQEEEQARLIPLFDDKLEANLAVLLKITLEMAKMADIEVILNS
jgi:hypothetical protein